MRNIDPKHVIRNVCSPRVLRQVLKSIISATFKSCFNLIAGGSLTQQGGSWLKVELKEHSFTSANVPNSTTGHLNLTWRWVRVWEPQSDPRLVDSLWWSLGLGSLSLLSCSKYNVSSSVPVQAVSNIKILQKQDKNYTYLDLIKTPELRKRTVLIGIVW